MSIFSRYEHFRYFGLPAKAGFGVDESEVGCPAPCTHLHVWPRADPTRPVKVRLPMSHRVPTGAAEDSDANELVDGAPTTFFLVADTTQPIEVYNPARRGRPSELIHETLHTWDPPPPPSKPIYILPSNPERQPGSEWLELFWVGSYREIYGADWAVARCTSGWIRAEVSDV